MPSTTELLATLPTRGCTRLLSASICQGKLWRMRKTKYGSCGGRGGRKELWEWEVYKDIRMAVMREPDLMTLLYPNQRR
jgi:hypothetical protein